MRLDGLEGRDLFQGEQKTVAKSSGLGRYGIIPSGAEITKERFSGGGQVSGNWQK